LSSSRNPPLLPYLSALSPLPKIGMVESSQKLVDQEGLVLRVHLFTTFFLYPVSGGGASSECEMMLFSHIRYNQFMFNIAPLEPINYLVIGHLTRDLTPLGPRLGGTVAYAGLTAQALGLKVGIVTAWGSELPLGTLKSIPIISYPAEHSTTFENIANEQGRIQIVHTVAPRLDYHIIPEPWRQAPIVHLGPVAQEVEPGLVRHFPNSLVGVTPQGWLRSWDDQGHVQQSEWPESAFILQQSGAAVLSLEDVQNDEGRIEEMASAARILAITEAAAGARVYWNGDVRRFRPPEVVEIDGTGAGDIFAAAFFIRLYLTRDPWESARFATMLAATSVTRRGLDGIPTPEEIQEHLIEVL
jgi:hypothetical protein